MLRDQHGPPDLCRKNANGDGVDPQAIEKILSHLGRTAPDQHQF